jgi:RNA polymerase sigma-70 factor (sigma-E family)
MTARRWNPRVISGVERDVTDSNAVAAAPTRGADVAEADAFRAFVAGYSPTLLRAALLLLRDRAAAEDVVQSTLLRTFRRWKRAREAPEAYSQKVLVNLCHDHWRHRRRHPESDTLEHGEQVPAPQVDLTDRLAQRQALERAMANLTSRQREVLVLRFFLDLSVAETAERLRIPEGTVKSCAHRGLAHLRDSLPMPEKETHHAER